MKPSEIITADAKRNGVNPAPILNKLGRSLKEKNAILMQSGNSVLIVQKIDKGIAELHLYTVDDRAALIRALREFIAKIRSSDLDAVYGNADNPQIIQMLKALGVEVIDSDLPEYNWKALV
jgi:uncharacterized protein related to proFAR isomerase